MSIDGVVPKWGVDEGSAAYNSVERQPVLFIPEQRSDRQPDRAATRAEAIARLLAKHGLAPRPPPPPSRPAPIAPGQLSVAFARSAR